MNQGGSRGLISGWLEYRGARQDLTGQKKLGLGGQVWKRQMKDEGTWKKWRTGVGAEKDRKACRVSCGRLAENLYSLKYSPKTSAAQYFHCSKYQWKALAKASTSFHCWLIQLTAACRGFSYSISPYGLDRAVTVWPLSATPAVDYRSSGGFDWVSKNLKQSYICTVMLKDHYWDNTSTPKLCDFRIQAACLTWVLLSYYRP